MITLKEIFHRTKKTENGCIEWCGPRNTYNYGILRFDGKTHTISRLVVELSGKNIPDGYYVCHKCDNPPCCNPEHLFIGSPKDNAVDAQKKGRRKIAEHGKIAMYTVNKCRCKKCKSSWNEYKKSYRLRLKKGTP